MYSSDSGGEATSNERDQKPFRRMRADSARGLSEWEFHGLQKCVEAAEALIFTLSEESRVRGAWRKVQWSEAERSDGWRKLVMDQSVVELSRWGEFVSSWPFLFERFVDDRVHFLSLSLSRLGMDGKHSPYVPFMPASADFFSLYL